MMHSLNIKFPIGIELSQAQAVVDRDYPQHTNYSPADCENGPTGLRPPTVREADLAFLD